MRVTVPWRQILRQGYVISLSDVCPALPGQKAKTDADLFGEAPPPRVKAIAEAPDPRPYFTELYSAIQCSSCFVFSRGSGSESLII